MQRLDRIALTLAQITRFLSIASVVEGRKRRRRSGGDSEGPSQNGLDEMLSLGGIGEEEDSLSAGARRVLHRETQRLRFIAMLEDGLSAGLQQHLVRIAVTVVRTVCKRIETIFMWGKSLHFSV